MNAAILEVKSDKTGFINKDVAGGMGTESNFGTGLIARLLTYFKKYTINYPPLLLGYSAAILRKNGFRVKAYFNMLPEADLIIMNSSIIDYKNEIEWAKKIKKKTNAKLGFIGTFASIKPELYLKYADFVIIGEPEEAIFNIKPNRIPFGLIKSDYKKNLDDLPFPLWDIFPFKTFKYKPYFPIKSKRFFPILSSRGCSMSCAYYCPYPIIGGLKYKERSIENVVAEIDYLVNELNADQLLFRDPIFSLNIKRTKKLAEEIIKRNLKVNYVCETHLNYLNKELIDILYDSGLRSIKIGIESSDESILKRVSRKIIEQKHQEEILNYCDEKGIAITAFYILGLPHDTNASMKSTIKYAIKINTIGAQFTVCTPYPGTKFYKDMEDQNLLLTKDYENYNAYKLVFKHPNFTPEELLKLKNFAYNKYYIRANWLWKILKIKFPKKISS